jgi:hypothetical protein
MLVLQTMAENINIDLDTILRKSKDFVLDKKIDLNCYWS